MSLLEVKDLSIHFGRRRVVDKVSFSLAAGEKLALVGESASGKTVTALSTLRLIQDARLTGSIRFAGGRSADCGLMRYWSVASPARSRISACSQT